MKKQLNPKKPAWREIAAETLKLSADSINSVIPLLDYNFDRIVDAIANIHESGRLIVLGIGKPSYIGMKISATFASIGVPSYFLNPTEALHGDLGRISKEDLVLALSLSGETPEVITAIPFIKQFSKSVFSITKDKDSTLAKLSDEVILTGEIEESWPVKIAPTSSTSVILALGDALAMSVATAKGFSKKDFAKFHPGGTLGRLVRPVTDVMRVGSKVAYVHQEMTTKDVIHTYTKTQGRPGAAIIVDKENALLGFFTDGDLRRLIDEGDSFLKRPISEVMNKNPKTISEDTTCQEALNFLTTKDIDQVVVIKNNSNPQTTKKIVLGLIDIQDVAEVFSGLGKR